MDFRDSSSYSLRKINLKSKKRRDTSFRDIPKPKWSKKGQNFPKMPISVSATREKRVERHKSYLRRKRS